MLYFVRHGQTDWNVAEKVQGTSDIELNETGIAQAEELAKELKDVDIDLIICSPLKRARKTAEIINKNKNCKLIVDEDFTERHFGEFEGKTRKEFPVEDFWNYKENFKYQKAECIGDFFSRVYKALDRIKEKYPGKNILVVSHGGVSRPVNCYFNGIPEDMLSLSMKNCEVVKFEF